MILFSGHKDLTLAGAEAALRHDRNDWTVERRESAYHGRTMLCLAVMRDGHEISVSLNTDTYVLEESRDIAGHHSGRLDAAKIAACDGRFAIGFEPREDMDNFNTLCFVQHSLRDLLRGDGITFMSNVNEFIDE
jgi:hypothetical protein